MENNEFSKKYGKSGKLQKQPKIKETRENKNISKTKEIRLLRESKNDTKLYF